MSKKKHAAEKAERKKFDAWVKVRSAQSPGDWVLTGGCDGECRWAWEGWKARAAMETAERLAPSDDALVREALLAYAKDSGQSLENRQRAAFMALRLAATPTPSGTSV